MYDTKRYYTTLRYSILCVLLIELVRVTATRSWLVNRSEFNWRFLCLHLPPGDGSHDARQRRRKWMGDVIHGDV